MPTHRELLLDLVAYVRALLPGQAGGVDLRQLDLLKEQDAVGLIGVKLSPEDDVWLQVRKVAEAKPPTPGIEVQAWIDGALDDTERRPRISVARGRAALERAWLKERSEQAQDPAKASTGATDPKHIDAGGGAAAEDRGETKKRQASAGTKLVLDPEEQQRFDLQLEDGRAQAEQWLSSQWEPWSEQTRKPRLSNKFYRKLFDQLTQLKLEGGAETDEIAFGLGRLYWKRPDGKTISKDLFVQACEIIDSPGQTNILQVRPAETAPESVVEALVKHNVTTAGMAKAWLDGQEALLEGLDPANKNELRKLAEGLTNVLAADGKLVDTIDEQAGPGLQIDLSWRLYRRERPSDRLRQDLDRLETVLKDPACEKDIPMFMRAVVDKQVQLGAQEEEEIAWRGSEAIGHPTSTASDLFFPLAYNDEQARAIHHLTVGEGAIVQGPPGTGKSHTIANIICHCLATGQRVLVAASTADALGVVREKMPAGIRDLTATLLSSDTESLAMFQKSVQQISYHLSHLKPSQEREQIGALEETLARLHKNLAEIDGEIDKMAQGHRQGYLLAGQHLRAEEIVQQWRQTPPGSARALPGMKRAPEAVPEQLVALVEEASSLRRWLGRAGRDEALYQEVPARVPDGETAWGWVEARVECLRAKQFQADLEVQLDQLQQDMLQLVPWTEDPQKEAQLVAAWDALLEAHAQLMDMHERRERFLAGGEVQAWEVAAAQTCDLGGEDPLLQRLAKIVPQLDQSRERGRALEGRVKLQSKDWLDNNEVAQQARDGLANLANGEPAFPWWLKPMRSQALGLIDTVRVDGGRPADAQEWGMVQQWLEHRRQGIKLMFQWNGLCKTMKWPMITLSRGLLGDTADAATYGGFCLQARRDALICAHWHNCLRPFTLHLKQLEEHPLVKQMLAEPRNSREAAKQIKDLVGAEMQAQSNLKDKLAQCRAQRQELLDGIARAEAVQQSCQQRMTLGQEQLDMLASSGLLGKQLAQGWMALGMGDEDDSNTARERVEAFWQAAGVRCALARECQEKTQELQGCMQAANSTEFADWVQHWDANMPGEGQQDTIIDPQWQEQWYWQLLDEAMRNFGSSESLEQLLKQRQGVVGELAECIQALATKRAWLSMAQQATPRMRQALSDYSASVSKQGSGKGKRAIRHRAHARKAMADAIGAVPCWIMPHGRVCESMPAQLGVFDVVIIDEASQSDIQALPTLLRGRKLLIVGDNKQVSPEAVGKSEQSFERWMAGPLARQPHAKLLLPDQSLYDLFGVVFSGRSVMLREHFRCVEAIIAYSNRNEYDQQIVPLRMPRREERLDPPLIDIVALDGVYKNEVNQAEAKHIADKIQEILADPSLAGKTIGVVTLTSNDRQAIAIKRELGTRDIGQDEWMKRQLAVGTGPSFQGKERDIVLVSMVWDGRNPKEGPRDVPKFRERFNVAMSRARDRIILVRSNHKRPFYPNSPLNRILEHFKDPLPVREGAEARLKGFPGQVVGLLREAGYRIVTSRTLVPEGVDLVIEGNRGRRGAVIFDGHRAIGMGHPWPEDIRRQRTLERAGWSVWRGFLAHFMADQEGFMASLVRALQQAEVMPGNGEEIEEPLLVEHVVAGEEIEEADQDEEEATPEAWPSDAGQWPQERGSLLEMCDSVFEQEVLMALLNMGYRVQPQYPCGRFLIDMVVQGPDGKQLAVECDGEQYHNLQNYDADQRRQLYIEQTMDIGFWRCWGSDWFNERDACLSRLQDSLHQAGVKPWTQGDGS